MRDGETKSQFLIGGKDSETHRREGVDRTLHNESPARKRSEQRFWPTGRMKKIVIHSDGACHGNPGPGGWAATLAYGPHHRELSGGVPATTNNRMELQAAIEALSALNERCEVEFYTDSKYVKNGVSSWLSKWKRNGWKTKSKKLVKNDDLWRALDSHASKHLVKWHWLKGHAGHAGNERCDQLANAEIAKSRSRSKATTLDTASGRSRSASIE
ncbi:MAG: ribonuclease HI [Terrimicrobiaceae bacterium]